MILNSTPEIKNIIYIQKTLITAAVI